MVNQLNGSYGTACGILQRMEKHRKLELQLAYVEFMQECKSLNHMSKLTIPESFDGYFIPHHITQKMTSSTTKYRVVFNASKKDKSGTSLNEHLKVGPPLQVELFNILIKFRRHLVAFCGDIEKMFRQIWVHEADQKYQKIVWRDDTNGTIESLQLNTVTYGTACAPYLATKRLQVIANGMEGTHPDASRSIKKDFYMDDWMTGRDSMLEAVTLQQTVLKNLADYGFPIRKFQSNCKEFLDSLDPKLVEILKEDRILGSKYVHMLTPRRTYFVSQFTWILCPLSLQRGLYYQTFHGPSMCWGSCAQ